ncbi:hypothetical protein EDD37DRAFT_631045 [Exophiala viscosa]|uniref:uncharacterized protein n=1 Tax=Exophiala viscosa TaxID=2486360 RepID=UPI00218EAF61|nr:hypothetical protein EDD37DRAFT_631045 [Exophiala viscosa]
MYGRLLGLALWLSRQNSTWHAKMLRCALYPDLKPCTVSPEALCLLVVAVNGLCVASEYGSRIIGPVPNEL